MYSQNNEEEIILNYLNKNSGSFLDIGSFDGITFSNVYQLALNGWSGVAVQPSPSVFPKLKQNYDKFDKIRLINKAIHTYDGKLKWFDSNGDALSTSSTDHTKKWNTVKFKQTQVQCVTTKTLLDENGRDFDFINIDVQGLNIQVFRAMDFQYMKNLKMLCVQHDNNFSQILNRMNDLKFKQVLRNGQNLILVKQ